MRGLEVDLVPRVAFNLAYPVRSGMVLVAVAALLVATGAAQASGTGQPSPLSAQEPVRVLGVVNESAPGAATHVTWPEPGAEFTLDASKATLDFRWRDGLVAKDPEGDPLATHMEDGGRDSPSFQNVSISIRGARDPLQVVAYPNGSNPRLRASGGGELVHHGDLPRYLTRVGASPEKRGAGEGREPLGFWYEPASNWLSAASLDEVLLEGDFEVFVNNATVTVYQDGRKVWENWTGYRTYSDGAATRFERHLLTMRLGDARLGIQAQDRVQLLGPRTEVEVTGAVLSRSVEGRLETPSGLKRFEGGALRLEGSGEIELGTLPGTRGSHPVPLALGVGEGSNFDVHGGAPIPGSSSEGVNLGTMDIALLLSAGTAVLVVAAERRTGAVGALASRWRSHRYERWMDRGRELSRGRSFEEAADCFRRAVEVKPRDGVAWYHLSLAHLEAGQPAEALDVVSEARDSKAYVDPLDFLEVEAEAAYRLGNHRRFREALDELVEGSEKMAVSLVRNLDVSEEALGPELSDRLRDEDPGEGLTGYV